MVHGRARNIHYAVNGIVGPPGGENYGTYVDSDIREGLREIFKFFPVVIVLLLVLWMGWRGKWYWSKGVHSIIKQVEQERDQWKFVAIQLLKEKGIDLSSTPDLKSIVDLVNNKKH